MLAIIENSKIQKILCVEINANFMGDFRHEILFVSQTALARFVSHGMREINILRSI